MAVIVPIHPSSLEYFDYCISYSDNTGEEYRDTVRNAFPDIAYIFSRVIFNSHSYDSNVRPEIEGLEIVKFDDIRMGTFMSAYGSTFISGCSVKEDYDGISCMSY